MEYLKLNGTFDINNYQIGQKVVSYADRIVYNQVKTAHNLMDVIPKKYHEQFVMLTMIITDHIPPHTDSGIKSTINFYNKPNTYETKFWEVIDTDVSNTRQVKNQTNGRLFDYKALKLLSSFTANPGEAYLLDVTKPHSVEKESYDGQDNERMALCIQSRYWSFSDVKEMLTETGYL